MKPRSKRNRKRPRSNVNALKEDPVYETTVRKLELDGNPIGKEGAPKWLRVVKPYAYNFSTYAKGRWEGRTIIDVYSTEFGSYPRSYYETAIHQGRILVSDKKVSTSYIVKGGDVLSHTVHRHEPGVAVQSNIEPYVKIISENEELVIVSKPGTMPVHPCGGYSVQSLMNILEKYYKDKSTEGINKLYTIHRLDRLTSGLVIIGKSSSVAQSYSKCIMNRSCQKIYLARVAGKFPLKYGKLKTLTSKEITQSGVPLHGEWKRGISGIQDENLSQNHQSSTSSKKNKTCPAASHLRKQYAHASWVADQDGEPVLKDEENIKTNILERVFRSRHSVNDWLKSIDVTIGEEERAGKLWFHLACPTRIAKHKDGICEASSFDDLDDEIYVKSVKPAHSSFGVVSYDEKTDSTLLICRPYTGRTHQLRLHLQHLEHPIANDPNYGGDIWYGNQEGRRACKIAQDRLSVINNSGDISSNTVADNSLDGNDKKKMKANLQNAEYVTNTSAIDVPATETEIKNRISIAVRDKEESIHAFIKRTCIWCARCRSVPSADRAILEFLIRSPGIWLHALQYSFPMKSSSNDDEKCGGEDISRSFRADLPEWHDF